MFITGELKHISKLRPWWVKFVTYYIKEPYMAVRFFKENLDNFVLSTGLISTVKCF